MSIDFIRPEVEELRPRISVIGVGGAGGNAIANMIQADVQGVDFIVANTDAQALNHSLADRKIQLGLRITQGLGAGSRPEIGKAAAEEAINVASWVWTIESGRRDLNPRLQPWQGCTLPLSYSRSGVFEARRTISGLDAVSRRFCGACA